MVARLVMSVKKHSLPRQEEQTAEFPVQHVTSGTLHVKKQIPRAVVWKILFSSLTRQFHMVSIHQSTIRHHTLHVNLPDQPVYHTLHMNLPDWPMYHTQHVNLPDWPVPAHGLARG